jgi:zinc transporter ZupT
MRNTPRDETVLNEFKRRRKRQLITSGVALFVALPVMALSGRLTLFGMPERAVLIVATTLIVGAVLFSLYNWRCPACNRYLGKAFNPSFCSGCGAQLRV